jgi:beta-glucanase (GH16 family)
LAKDFHVFAVKWTADEVTWFLDGNPVFRVPTPSDMHKPMYVVLNLAVGGDWPGSPDDTTPFPSEFEIDYVRVYTPSTSNEKEPNE